MESDRVACPDSAPYVFCFNEVKQGREQWMTLHISDKQQQDVLLIG